MNVLRKVCNPSLNFPLFHRCSGTRSLSSSSPVVVENIGTVELIGLNRPERRNAVDPPTAKILYNAFKNFEQNENRTVAILYGKEGIFCAGYDLKALSTVEKDIPSDEPVDAELGPMGRVPLIDGGTVRLPRLIGLSRALDLILTGREIGAKEAYEYGLANRVVPHGKALDAAIELAQSLVKFPQKCMNTDRNSAYYNMYNAESVDAALQHEYTEGIKVITDEAIPGAKNFVKGLGKHGSFDIGDQSGRKSKL